VGGLTFIEQTRRELRQVVLAVDCGRTPASGLNVQIAIDLELVYAEIVGEDRYELMLTDAGQEFARRWRDADGHGGSAA
jgi:hypothetical protein